MAKQTDLMKGTLQLLVLKTLALEPRHGVKSGLWHEIAREAGGSMEMRRVVVVEEIQIGPIDAECR